MIGILCSNNREGEFAEELHFLFKRISAENNDSIIVFAISNIDFNSMTVSGFCISGEKAEKVQLPLPSVIFNFSLQQDAKSIKSRKLLEEIDNVRLINYVNKYDQSMIMDILSSYKTARSYLLPFNIYNKDFRDYRPEEDKTYIVTPSRGASLSRLIYAEPVSDSNVISGTQYFKKGHICDYIDACKYQKRWIFITAQDLMVSDGHPLVIRTYLQKSSKHDWMILGADIHPDKDIKDDSLFEKVGEKVQLSINYISHFIPSLGHCFIDSVISNSGNPYFLHLGGYDKNFLRKMQEEAFCKKLYNNISNLARCYGNAAQKED